MMDTKLMKKDTLQAVVIADDFSTNLTPMHNVLPSILVPVVNIPLLEYLIETLVTCGIKELFLYCSNHIDLLKSYVQKIGQKDLVITLIISDGCRSLGDALRDIDTKGWIRGNFILIRGDAFINANLRKILTVHQNKLQKDKGTAMTMVLRNCGSMHNSMLKDETCIVVSKKANKNLLFYKKLNKDEKKVSLELNWFLENHQIEINTNFLDSHVYFCSPAFLPLFADNFDFQTMEDFIRGVLMNEEILNSRIYWEQLNPEEYSLPITSWKAYHVLSHDILHRHSFPLVPNGFSGLKNYIYMPRCTYKHTNSTLAKGCSLEKNCLLGRNSSLGKNSLITRSIIGDNCTIGQDVVINNSYIMSNAIVKNKCIIENSILFPNCILEEEIKMDGCILSSSTKVNANKLYVDSILEYKEDNLIVSNMFDHEEIEQFLYFKNAENSNDDNYSTDELSSNESSDRDSPLPDDANMFLSEVIESLLRGYQDKLDCKHLILEINSSRYAYNVGIREVSYNVIKAILNLPFNYLSDTKTPINDTNYQDNLKIMLNYFHTIIKNYVKTKDGQEDCLRAIEDVALTTKELLPFAQRLLYHLYNIDVLSEEKILEWYETRNEDFKEELKVSLQRFIDWLKEAEDDSTESDD